MLRRSTMGIVGRMVATLVILVAAHMGARLLYNVLFGSLRPHSYPYGASVEDPSIWSVQIEYAGDWLLFGMSHLFVAVIFGILALIIYGAYSLIRWIFFAEVEIICVDPGCRCALHGGTTHAEYRKKQQDEAARGALVAATAAVVTTTIIN